MQAGALGGMFHSGPPAAAASSSSPPAEGVGVAGGGGCSGGGSSMAAVAQRDRDRRRPHVLPRRARAVSSRESGLRESLARVSRDPPSRHLGGAEAAGGHRDEGSLCRHAVPSGPPRR